MAVHDSVCAEYDGALNAVFQLAHVAGPVIAHHHVDSRREIRRISALC